MSDKLETKPGKPRTKKSAEESAVNAPVAGEAAPGTEAAAAAETLSNTDTADAVGSGEPSAPATSEPTADSKSTEVGSDASNGETSEDPNTAPRYRRGTAAYRNMKRSQRNGG